MTNEEILANAPEGATHIDSTNVYLKLNDIQQWESFSWCSQHKQLCWVDITSPIFANRSLSDIRRIIELEKQLTQAAKDEMQWRVDTLRHKERAEAAERERDELAAYKAGKESMKLQQDDIINKFAIEQQIKGIYEATNYVADNNDISYLPNDFILELCEKYAEQLRQQINGGE